MTWSGFSQRPSGQSIVLRRHKNKKTRRMSHSQPLYPPCVCREDYIVGYSVRLPLMKILLHHFHRWKAFFIAHYTPIFDVTSILRYNKGILQAVYKQSIRPFCVIMLPSGDSVSPKVVGPTPATLGDAPLHGYAVYLFIDKREKGEAKIRREQREDVTACLNVTVLSGVALWWLILLRTADMTTVINVSLSVIVPLIALLYDIDSAINYVRSNNKRGRLRILRAWAELHPFAGGCILHGRGVRPDTLLMHSIASLHKFCAMIWHQPHLSPLEYSLGRERFALPPQAFLA